MGFELVLLKSLKSKLPQSGDYFSVNLKVVGDIRLFYFVDAISRKDKDNMVLRYIESGERGTPIALTKYRELINKTRQEAIYFILIECK